MDTLRSLVTTSTLMMLLAAAVAGQELGWNDLVARPELRPGTATMLAALAFQSGARVEAGDTVNVLELNPGEVVVQTLDGALVFGASPTDTDVLDVARRAWALLSPEQRALTQSALRGRPDLWPYRVALVRGASFSNGTELPRGLELVFLRYQGNRLELVHDNGIFVMEPEETDLMQRARAVLAANAAAGPAGESNTSTSASMGAATGDPSARNEGARLAQGVADQDGVERDQPARRGTRGRLFEELDGRLIHAATGEPAQLDAGEDRLIAFYFSAGWCGPCRKFSPKLVEFYERVKADHPELEIVFVSADKSEQEMRDYIEHTGFPWLAVPFGRNGELPLVNSYPRKGIPHLLVLDQHGTVVADTVRNGVYIGADAALASLTQVLDRPLAR